MNVGVGSTDAGPVVDSAISGTGAVSPLSLPLTSDGLSAEAVESTHAMTEEAIIEDMNSNCPAVAVASPPRGSVGRLAVITQREEDQVSSKSSAASESVY